MEEKTAAMRYARFGQYLYDTNLQKLYRNSQPVALTAQQVQVLELLIARAGATVDRDTIKQALWSNTVVVEFDQSINFIIRQLRKSLDDDARDARYIKTIPRRGYQLIPSVSMHTSPEITRSTRRLPAATHFLRYALLLGFCLVAIGCLLMYGPAGSNNVSISKAQVLDQRIILDTKRARYLLDSGEPDRIAAAIQLLEQVSARNPNSGLPNALLGLALIAQSHDDSLQPRIKQQLDQAIALDPTRAETQFLQGKYALLFERDFDLAVEHFAAAVQKRPEWIALLHDYSVALALTGAVQEAEHSINKILAINPGLAQERYHMGWFQLAFGQPVEALSHLQMAIDINDKAWLNLRAAYAAQLANLSQTATDHVTKALAHFALDEATQQALIQSASEGDLAPTFVWWGNWLAEHGFSHFSVASQYAIAGQTESALAQLELSKQARELELILLTVTPEFKPLLVHAPELAYQLSSHQ